MGSASAEDPDPAAASVVRPANSTDLDSVARIYAHYVDASVATFEYVPPDESEWARRFAKVGDAGLPFLVAQVGGSIAGYAYAARWRTRPAYQHSVEDSVYVAPWVIGRGVGRTLLEELVSRCADAGVREIIAVITDSDDDRSVALHQRCGFAHAGRLARVGYKHDRWLDTLLMQRSLVAPASA